MMVRWWVSVGLVALLGVGCSGNDPTFEEPDSLDGVWGASVTVDGTAYVFSLTLQQSGAALSGTGNYATPGESVTFSVAGSYTPPDLELDFQLPDEQVIRFIGDVNRDLSAFAGDLRGPGLDGASLEFVREP